MRMLLPVSALVVLSGAAWAAGLAAPTFQELMKPDLFPEAQHGMSVEAVESGTVSEPIRVRTTGADISLDVVSGVVTFGQRIGHVRPVAELRFGTPMQGAQVSGECPPHRGSGFARITVQHPDVTFRVNGDSLLMLHAHEPVTITIRRRIAPGWHASDGPHHLIADEWGAFGLYCSDRKLADAFDPYADDVARYTLPADAVLWVAVCPPKPYDWDRSLHDNVVWHWSDKLAYPADDVLRSWQPHGNIVLLQSEVMLWKDWSLDFVPRLGPEEFARVRKTVHDLGMRFIVYTSPYYFTKGTPEESQAMNSFENFKGFSPGNATGMNMELFLDAITRVMRDLKPDGLYFDGQYISDPAALYALARRSRAIVGEEGILEWHSTNALGSGQCYLPQADAYTDIILRGEGQGGLYNDADYLRFFVSGYNINNCEGVLCTNGPPPLSTELVRRVLGVNARLHTLAGWLDTPEVMRVLNEDYKAHLTPDLRATVDREVDARQAAVSAKVAEYRAEVQGLAAPPAWDAPALSLVLDSIPQAERVVSPANAEPFSVVDGALRVHGRAHTYAFSRLPYKAKVAGFVVKLRQGTDGGMSWGPAAMLCWPDGSGVRIGTRSDGTLQADVLGTQWHGASYMPSQWVWLRARWLRTSGVTERSNDGAAFERIWTFQHGGGLLEPPAGLLIGKVPYNGQPVDFTDAGPPGDSDFAAVQIYSPK